MTIDWRLVVFELVNFIVLMALLGRFLFRPLREMVEQRRADIEQRNQEVEAREAAAKTLREEYEGKLRAVASEVQQTRAEARREAEAEGSRIVASAREEMELARSRSLQDMERAVHRAHDDLREDLLRLAVRAAKRVVDGMESASLHEAYARLGARRLHEEAAPERGATIQMWVAPDADAGRLEQVVREVLDEEVEFETTKDSNLVGGVRLLFRDLEVDASAGTALRSWIEPAPQGSPA